MTKLKLLAELPQIDYSPLNTKLIETRSNISVLKGACFGLPNPKLLLSPTMIREALESSEIENIVTTLADVLQAQLFSEPERSLTDKEVLRYNYALNAGLAEMKHRYLGVNTIRMVHKVLIPDEPDFRVVQNALINNRTGEVVYTPVACNEIPRYLSDLELFLNNEEDGLDPVLKTILAHYQFEAIHPFGDGNGRTGRILIVLCLVYLGLLDLPVMFVSEYINHHKAQYYRVFRGATERGDYMGFVDYMLDALNEQAKKSTRILLEIRELYDETRRRIREDLPKIYSRDLVDTIFNQPLMTSKRYEEMTGVSYPTALSHLRQLEEAGIMSSQEVGKYRIYTNIRLMEFLNSQRA